jgi:phospholipase/carboxylesterase
MTDPKLTYKTIEPTSGQTNQLVFWLHGLGATADDFAPIAHMMALHDTKFIFPQAPNMPVTINAGMVMPAWFDIYGIGPQHQEDESGINRSSRQLVNLINELKKEHPDAKVKLIGFSQGGAVSLYTALLNPELCPDVLGLSCYLPLSRYFLAPHNKPKKTDLPKITLMHGEHDDVIPLEFAKLSEQLLQNLGYEINFTSYNMRHEVSPEQIHAIINWI